LGFPFGTNNDSVLHRRGNDAAKKHATTGESDLFRARLDQIINMKHELAQLAGKLDWNWLDNQIARLFSDQGRPATPTRFMIGLLLLKHIFAKYRH
jgi:IS5 family transposase